MLNLLNRYITGNDATKAAIDALVKTEPYKRIRRQCEDRLRKDTAYFLAIMDVERRLK